MHNNSSVRLQLSDKYVEIQIKQKYDHIIRA